MSNVIYPGRGEVPGPWLLESDDLSSFEELLKDIAAEQTAASEDREFSPKYEISFDDGQCIVANSLEEIGLNHAISNKLPVRLTAEISSNGRYSPCSEFAFRLNNRILQNFEYDIRCGDKEDVKLRCVNKVNNWIDLHKPSKFLQWWHKNSFVILIACFAAFFILLWSFSSATSTSTLYFQSLLPQVQSLLEEGINETNYLRALELLLIKEFSYVPTSFSPTLPGAFATSFVCSIIVLFIIAIIGAISPKANIALGAGKKQVKRWKGYVKLITYTIPVMIVLPIIINILTSIF